MKNNNFQFEKEKENKGGNEGIVDKQFRSFSSSYSSTQIHPPPIQPSKPRQDYSEAKRNINPSVNSYQTKRAGNINIQKYREILQRYNITKNQQQQQQQQKQQKLSSQNVENKSSHFSHSQNFNGNQQRNKIFENLPPPIQRISSSSVCSLLNTTNNQIYRNGANKGSIPTENTQIMNNRNKYQQKQYNNIQQQKVLNPTTTQPPPSFIPATNTTTNTSSTNHSTARTLLNPNSVPPFQQQQQQRPPQNNNNNNNNNKKFSPPAKRTIFPQFSQRQRLFPQNPQQPKMYARFHSHPMNQPSSSSSSIQQQQQQIQQQRKQKEEQKEEEKRRTHINNRNKHYDEHQRYQPPRRRKYKRQKQMENERILPNRILITEYINEEMIVKTCEKLFLTAFREENVFSRRYLQHQHPHYRPSQPSQQKEPKEKEDSLLCNEEVSILMNNSQSNSNNANTNINNDQLMKKNEKMEDGDECETEDERDDEEEIKSDEKNLSFNSFYGQDYTKNLQEAIERNMLIEFKAMLKDLLSKFEQQKIKKQTKNDDQEEEEEEEEDEEKEEEEKEKEKRRRFHSIWKSHDATKTNDMVYNILHKNHSTHEKMEDEE